MPISTWASSRAVSARGRLQIAGTIDASGVRSNAAADIVSLEWSKFAAWAAMMVLSVTTRARTWEYATDPGAALVMARLVREVGQLADARHVRLSDQPVLPVASICRGSEAQAVAAIRRLGLALKSNAPEHRMSSLHDLAAGRPLEIEETLGHAVRMAQQCNLSVAASELLLPAGGGDRPGARVDPAAGDAQALFAAFSTRCGCDTP